MFEKRLNTTGLTVCNKNFFFQILSIKSTPNTGYVRTYKFKSKEVLDHQSGRKTTIQKFFENPTIIADFAEDTMDKNAQRNCVECAHIRDSKEDVTADKVPNDQSNIYSIY